MCKISGSLQESGITFSSQQWIGLWKIEDSEVYQKYLKGQYVKIVDFIGKKSPALWFIEVKSSFAPEDKDRPFQKQCEDILQKFHDTMLLCWSICLGKSFREWEKRFDKNLCDTIKLPHIDVHCCLIVKGANSEQANSIQDTLRHYDSMGMSKLKTLFRVKEIWVYTEEIARKKGIIL
ncbi:MAG: hypothetical protein HPY78_09855 [Brevinematales bacterium]|nr:hypothetical protein [Brevinematales bacterium]